MKKISFIIKGNLKSCRIFENKCSIFRTQNYQLEFLYTRKRYHACILAQEAINNGCNYIIAVGGDGTLNEVVNGIMQFDHEIRKNIILGLFPAGTGNDFARTIGMKSSINQLFRLISEGAILPVDIGKISYINFQKELQSRYFINIADIGIGGQVVARVNKSKKQLGAALTFIISVLKEFIHYKRKHVKLITSDFEWEGEVVSLCMANGRYFGGGLGVAPQAKIDDGMIQLVIVGNIKTIEFLKYLPNLRAAKPIKHKEVNYLAIEKCTFESLDADCPIDLDGEFVGFPPVNFKLYHHAIKMFREK